MKHDLSLADQVVAECGRSIIHLQKRSGETIHETSLKELMRHAEKFDISREAGDLAEKRYLNSYSGDMARGMRLPFPSTWLEDYAGNGVKLGHLMREYPEGIVVYPFSRVFDKVRPCPLVYFIQIDTGRIFTEQLSNDSWVVREAAKMESTMKSEIIHHALRIITLISDTRSVQVGERVHKTGKFYHSGKFRPYFTHRVVNLVPDAPPGRARESGQGTPHRAHTVRGFWRRHPKTKERTIFVESHQRGDASLGWVYHDYDVHRDGECRQ